MMIQGSSPVSILTGLENNSTVPQGSGVEGGESTAFTSSLMRQLAILQETPVNDVAADTNISSGAQLPENLNSANSVPLDMQNFAALMGKNSIAAKKSDLGINLDATLNALNDVLQHLQGLDTSSSRANLNPTVDNKTVKTEKATTLSGDSQQDVLRSAEEALLAAVMPTFTQPNPQAKLQNQVNEPTLGDSLPSSAANSTLVFNSSLDQSGVKKSSMDDGFLKMFKTGEVARKGGDGQDQAGIQAETFNNGVLGVSSSSSDPGQYNGDNQQFTGSGNGDPAGSFKQSLSPANDQTSTSVVTDVANLNQVVSAGNSNQMAVMDKPIAHPQWNAELGEKVIWMRQQDIPSAELRLNPQHLGPVSIKVDVDQGQTSISFITHHAEVKDAIEAAIPKLREMLGDQQLNLADVNVSQQNQGRGSFQASNGQNQGNSNASQSEYQDSPASQPVMDIDEEINSGRAITSNGLLSIFA